jgi:follistatin-related protein 5
VKYCDKGRECIITPSNRPKCICQRECVLFNKRKRRHVCGSNGKLYQNFCELYRDSCLTGQKITIRDIGECVKKEPACSADDYAIMKDNLLLYHHQNMVYLQHGPDAPVHRMDYLVSIIFSHYDQNNDGLVEKDELTLMWSTMDMHHVANDSNCTLLDMFTYDDMNRDHVLTINEFNDAFHRISQTRSVVETVEQDVPKIHLDVSLTLNHLKVHVGDNVEIKCDISGASSSGVIWKRFGFDLSQISNDTDDYDEEGDINDEIKLTPDGGLYIQNVQMKHAGNYTCQMSTNGMIVQTHVLNVHGEISRLPFTQTGDNFVFSAQPVILISPEMQSKRPGESAEIVCLSIGEFVTSIDWSKNEKPLDGSIKGKFTVLGNGTSLRINHLSYSDTGAYTCTSVGGHSGVSTLVIQADPTPIATTRDEKVFVFHDNGISIYSSGLCQLVHEIHAGDFVPGTDDTICNQNAKRCTWGRAVTIDAPDGLIYITQPMMDRILVLSIAQLIIIEIIPTDGTPMELHHIPLHDQLWIVNHNLRRDGTIKADPAKTLQMLPDVRMIHVKHHPVHPEKINGEMMNFYVPPVYSHQEHIHDFKFGLVTHHKQRGFFKLDLSTMRYARYVDLSIYDCVPEHIKFGGLCEFRILPTFSRRLNAINFLKFQTVSSSSLAWNR